MKAKVPVSDLLAHRDGEALDALRAAQIEADAEARQTLLQLRTMKQALNELPTIEPDAAVWATIEKAQSSRRFALGRLFDVSSSSWLSSRAIAAAVFVATAIGVVLWFPAPSVEAPQIADSRPAVTMAPVDLLYTAQLRSQSLESQVNNSSVLRGNRMHVGDQQAILYAIAQLDGELNRIAFAEPDNRELRESLWQRRVALLESLVTVQQTSPDVTPSYY